MKTVIIGCDHAGLDLKVNLMAYLDEMGHQTEDLGTHDPSSVDYPDYAQAVAQAVQANPHKLGLLICGTGIGMSIAANKVAGARAALCHCEYEAEKSRAHNDANILCLGARVITEDIARRVLAAFMVTDFEGGRHGRRVDKIRQLEC